MRDSALPARFREEERGRAICGRSHAMSDGCLARELFDAARRIAEALKPPPVARVFVPPEGLGPDRRASFCAVQLVGGSTGLAYVSLGDTRDRLRSANPVQITGGEVLGLVAGFTRRDPTERALGLAALNALTRHLLDRVGFEPDLAANSLGSLALGPDDRLGMVGLFPPLVRRARDEGIPLVVVELDSELVREVPGMTVTLDPALLATCNKVVCTSSALLNDSLDDLLEHARGCREFVVIGPSAGCVPDPLFARGVTGTGGAWVSEPAAWLERAARGEPWGEASRKFSLRRETWPGLDEMLRRGAA